jgi:hypothetical protein
MSWLRSWAGYAANATGEVAGLGFRWSGHYQEWRLLLRKFDDPFPLVEHYELVQRVGDHREIPASG